MPFSISAVVGCIALFGIAVMNDVVLTLLVLPAIYRWFEPPELPSLAD